MKAKYIIVLISLILIVWSLSSCSSEKHDRTAEPYLPPNTEPPSFGKIEPLSIDVKSAFEEIGIDVKGTIFPIIDSEGKIFLIEDEENLLKKELRYPHDAKEIRSITNITIIQWTKSKCTTVIIDGREERRCQK